MDIPKTVRRVFRFSGPGSFRQRSETESGIFKKEEGKKNFGVRKSMGLFGKCGDVLNSKTKGKEGRGGLALSERGGIGYRVEIGGGSVDLQNQLWCDVGIAFST